MPPHLNYVEPYAGGLAVLLAKNPDSVAEVVNNLHGDLTNFLRVLQYPPDFERFLRIVDAVAFSEPDWNDAGAWLAGRPNADVVERAVWFFSHCRQSLAGRMDCFATLTRNRTRRGMNEQASAWRSTVNGLPAVHARLLRAAILNRSALEVIRTEDGPGTLFYCDPPYLHETRTARKVYGPLEMSEADHRHLLDALRQCKGKVMLSGYPSALYDAELAGWNRHILEVPN
jgi:DNA adenine methylase